MATSRWHVLFHRNEIAARVDLDFVRNEPGAGGKFPPEPTITRFPRAAAHRVALRSQVRSTFPNFPIFPALRARLNLRSVCR